MSHADRGTRIGGDNHHPSVTTRLDAPAQNQDSSRRLNCHIEGGSNVFPVIVAIHKQVGDLQEEIFREQEQSTFKDVGAYTLELCDAKAIDKSLCEVALAYFLSLTGQH